MEAPPNSSHTEEVEEIKTAVLLVNLGTPTACTVPAIRRYLREFLMDGRVIDIPWLLRFLLVQGIIAPFRSYRAKTEYAKLWTPQGSPLQYHTRSLCQKLAKALGDKYVVRYAMRYQKPSMKHMLSTLQTMPLSRLILVPLFPQYASATTGSVIEAVMKPISQWQIIPSLTTIYPFHLRKAFLHAWHQQARPYIEEKPWDAFLFSYHGLPERHIKKGSISGYCHLGSCCNSSNPKNQYCYRAQCFQTTAALARYMKLPIKRCYTTFQSRLGKNPWLQPYTEEVVKKLPHQGIKQLLVFSPAFVADCLETTLEIGETYKKQFLDHGGKDFRLVPSLNDSAPFVKALSTWVQQAAE